MRNHIVITIDQEAGSKGAEVGQALSQKLGIPCYTTEILTEAAKQSRIPEKLLRRYDERPVFAAYNFAVEKNEDIKLPASGDFVAAQVAACRALAESGSCILVDRHATLALEGNKDAVNVFLHAKDSNRAEALADAQCDNPEKAMKKLKRTDRVRERYYRSYEPHWGESSHYHLSIDVGQLGIEKTTDQILSYITVADYSGEEEAEPAAQAPCA